MRSARDAQLRPRSGGAHGGGPRLVLEPAVPVVVVTRSPCSHRSTGRDDVRLVRGREPAAVHVDPRPDTTARRRAAAPPRRRRPRRSISQREDGDGDQCDREQAYGGAQGQTEGARFMEEIIAYAQFPRKGGPSRSPTGESEADSPGEPGSIHPERWICLRALTYLDSTAVLGHTGNPPLPITLLQFPRGT